MSAGSGVLRASQDLVGILCTVLCLVTQSCLTLCDPVDCSPPGSSVHGILQARILEWLAMSSSTGSSQTRDWTQVSHIAGRFFTIWATREPQEYWSGQPIPSPGDLPDPVIKRGSPALQADSLPTELPGKPRLAFCLRSKGRLAIEARDMTARMGLEENLSVPAQEPMWPFTQSPSRMACCLLPVLEWLGSRIQFWGSESRWWTWNPVISTRLMRFPGLFQAHLPSTTSGWK